EALHRIDRHVDHRSRWDIVDDDGDADCVVDRLEMLVQPLLRWLVVIRSDNQYGIGAGAFGVVRKVNRLRGRIGTRSGDHRHATASLLDAPLDSLVVLLVRERRAFAGGANRNKPIGTLGNLPVDQVPKGFLVHRSVLEGSYKRRK